MKKYKAIFFDWDGTAVVSRKASADQVAKPMKRLLAEGVKLVFSISSFTGIFSSSKNNCPFSSKL